MNRGFPISTRLTAAQVAAGEGDDIAGGFIEVIDANAQPTGTLYSAGPVGTPPAVLGGTAAAAAASVPESLAGTGAIALTQALHAGKNWHAENGQTSLTLATADWTGGGEFSVINHSGELLPIALGAGLTGYVNAQGMVPVVGAGVLTQLAPYERATVQVKDGAFVNVSVGAAGIAEQGWAAATNVKAGEIRRATTAQGTIGAGDRMVSASTRKTRASFDATEAGNWTELPEDPDVVLGTDSRLTDARAPTAHSHAQSEVTDLTTDLAAKQATLVSGTNIKTLNSQSLLGGGDIAVGASSASVTVRGDGVGGIVTQVGNDRVHTFTADGNFVVPTGVSAVRVLLVAGGGGGGTGRYIGDAAGRPGGGGGAGGLIHNAAFAVTPGATIPVTVGAGGIGATDLADSDNGGTGGSNGGSSVFDTLTAVGGGGGGGHYAATVGGGWDAPANTGGSGGGGSNGSAGAAGTASQGSAGNPNASPGGGGGGGAGGAGGNGGGTLAEGAAAGTGGAGLANDIRTGVNATYAAGGASSGLPTSGVSGVAGAINSGNGGSGATRGGSNGRAVNTSPGGNGGTGIVIVRYLYQSLDTPTYANNAAAIGGGLTLGQLYRTGADPDVLCVVH